ncbi:DUF4231 domain-containing protein [Paenibacillus rigui]|uniref:DUF4231 domain-containing protein n=1 Tax=Paenibacillus rigui TaxID=554312 RepID=A0A229UMA3_9BACL|nr:DUF4231 domain-containing protein [Paenibacillus rigui]OXM84578.1 hypothetical protein CF651_18895 [Paenibacillus rigui]
MQFKFPSAFEMADYSSIEAQNKYLQLSKIDLIIMPISAFLGAFSFLSDNYKIFFSVLAAILIAISIIIKFIIRIRQYEKIWFGCRAVAESIKTISWKYMMSADPFTSSIESSKKELISSLQNILTSNKSIISHMLITNESNQSIPDTMTNVKLLDLNKRKSLYIENRVSNQLEWYQKKAENNKTLEERWFYCTIFLQVVALTLAIIFANNPTIPLNLTGFFVTLSTTTLAWIKLKQYQELSQAYSVTAAEISLILQKSEFINSDETLSNYVADAENAFSREHTLWIARRDHLKN